MLYSLKHMWLLANFLPTISQVVLFSHCTPSSFMVPFAAADVVTTFLLSRNLPLWLLLSQIFLYSYFLCCISFSHVCFHHNFSPPSQIPSSCYRNIHILEHNSVMNSSYIFLGPTGSINRAHGSINRSLSSTNNAHSSTNNAHSSINEHSCWNHGNYCWNHE